MKKILMLISLISLGMTIVPAFLVFVQKISMEQNMTLMLIGTIGWFVTAPFWMKKETSKQ